MSTYYFVIVGHNDNPIFEKEFSTLNKEQRVSTFISTSFMFYTNCVTERGSQASQPVHSTCCIRFGR